MKLKNKIIFAIFILGFYATSKAEITSYSGGFLKSGGDLPISESLGCYFNFSKLPVDIPDGSVIIGVTMFTYNISSTNESPSVRIFKHTQDQLPDLLLDQNYDAPPGYSSAFAPASLLSPIEPKEFLVLYNFNGTDQTGICGIQVHHLIDLIFNSGFD